MPADLRRIEAGAVDERSGGGVGHGVLRIECPN
jgi:hypothetical protein